MKRDSGNQKVVKHIGSKMRAAIALASTTVLVLAGVTLIGVVPASATEAVLTFSGVPASGNVDHALSTFEVLIGGGGSSGDQIEITSAGSCTLSGGDDIGTTTGTTATFDDVIISTAGTCTLTATDETDPDNGTGTSSSIAIGPTKLAFSTSLPSDATLNVALPSFTVSDEGPTGVADDSASDTITVTISGTSCEFSGGADATTESTTSGVATFSDVDIAGGTTCTLTATDTDYLDLTSATSTIVMAPQTPTQLGFSTEPSSTATAGTALASFAVSVEESNGVIYNPTTTYTDLITLTSSCKMEGATTAYTVNGVATFADLIFETAGVCYLTATDSSRSLPTTASSAVEVNAGTPTHLAFVSSPPTTVNGTGITLSAFEVGVEDEFNNVETTEPGFNDTIVLSSACGLSGTTTVNAAAGLATFSNISFTTTGSCTLTATDTTRTLTVATATVVVGEPQATLTVSTTTGYLDSPLTLATKGGSGTGAVTYSVTNGTATGCTITDGALSATTGGTCIVTATKAAASPYASATSAATTVTISSAPKALRLIGTLTIGRTATVNITGYNFSGRPKAISNVAGFTALVTHDSGKTLTLRVTVRVTSTKPGVKTMTLVFANGDRTSFKYSLH